MNYGTFTGFIFTNNKRIWPVAIEGLLIDRKCCTMDDPALDGTGWIRWDDDQIIIHPDIVEVSSTDPNGKKAWDQRSLNQDQERLDAEKSEDDYAGDSDFAIYIDSKQTIIDAQQIIIDAM